MEYTLPSEREHWIETAVRLYDLQLREFINLEKERNTSPDTNIWSFNFGCWGNGHLLDCYWDEFEERVRLRTPNGLYEITKTEHPSVKGMYLPQYTYHDRVFHIARRPIPQPAPTLEDIVEMTNRAIARGVIGGHLVR